MPDMSFKLSSAQALAAAFILGAITPVFAADVSATAPAFSVVSSPGSTVAGEGELNIVFPPPPDPPRIRYLYSLAQYSDLGIPKRGFWGKTWDFLAGNKIPEGFALVRAYGVCAVGDRVYAADSEGSAVVVFDRVGKTITRFGGKLSGRLVSPICVATDGKERVYVSDSLQKLVNSYDLKGNFLFKCSGADMERPTGLAWDGARNRLLVVDTKAAKVLSFGPDGIKRGEYPVGGEGPDAINTPVNIAVGPGGEMYLTDPIKCGVWVYSSEGKFLRKWGECGDTAGNFYRPRGVALDSDGNIYVADAMFNVVQIFDANGRLLLFFGAPGTEPGAFGLPAGVFIDGQDRIYVSDSDNHRVQVFQYLTLEKSVQQGHEEKLDPFAIKFELDPPGSQGSAKAWKVEINDRKFGLLRRYSGSGLPPKEIEWDGLDERGRPPIDMSKIEVRMKVLTVKDTEEVTTGTLPAVNVIPPMRAEAGDPVFPEIEFGMPQMDFRDWHLELSDAGQRIQEWSGKGRPPETVVWSGRNASGFAMPLKTPAYTWNCVDSGGRSASGHWIIPQVEVKVEEAGKARFVRMTGLAFTGGDGGLNADQLAVLSKISRMILKHSGAKLHIDSYGPEKGGGQTLAKRHADEIIDAVISRYGVANPQILVNTHVSAGESGQRVELAVELPRQ